jgi:alanine racemase
MVEYNRVVAEVNLDAIAYNVKNIRAIINNETSIMAVVKADAYGHGAVEVAKVALYNGASALAVAMTDEGIQLRNHNINVPILILGYTPELKIEESVKYNLIQTVFTYEMACAISKVATKLGKIAQIHIKLDTGMGRIGFSASKESEDIILSISKLDHIEINGIFTHFATSDEMDKTFTYRQAEIFEQFSNALEKRGLYIPVKHAANSGAIMELPQFSFNMVRAGIIIYGMYPSEDVDKAKLSLKPAMGLKTQISYIKNVDKDVSISYGRTYYTKEQSKIATVPVGYADGYSRLLSNCGRVLVKGSYAPIVGRVCMDQFMIDVTGIDDVNIGDDVVLIGCQCDNTITAEEIANCIGTINYEVVCMIGKRIPRVYIKNNSLLKTVSYF